MYTTETSDGSSSIAAQRQVSPNTNRYFVPGLSFKGRIFKEQQTTFLTRLVLPNLARMFNGQQQTTFLTQSIADIQNFAPGAHCVHGIPLEVLKMVSLWGLWNMPTASRAILSECRGSRGLLLISGLLFIPRGLLLILGQLLSILAVLLLTL